MTIPQDRRLAPIRLLLACALLVHAAACTHLSSARNSSLSKEIRDGFEEYRRPDRHPYALAAVKSGELGEKASARESEMVLVRGSLFAGTVAGSTWKEIRAALEVEKARRVGEMRPVQEELSALFKEWGEKEKAVGDAEEGVAQASRVLEKALAEERKWDARQILFRSAARYFSDASAEIKERLDLKKLREEIFRTKIAVESRGAEGGARIGDVTVGEVLAEEREDVRKLPLETLLKRFTVSDVDPGVQPALVATMLSFSSDLADIQREKARSRTEYLKARIDLLAARAVPSRAGKRALETVSELFERGLVLPDETVLSTVDRLRKKKGSEDDVRAVLRAVGDYAVSRTLDREEGPRLWIRRAELDRGHALKQAALDAKEEEALISRGLQGLAIYHEGGITPEMIANFLRGAQAAALAAISVGI